MNSELSILISKMMGLGLQQEIILIQKMEIEGSSWKTMTNTSRLAKYSFKQYSPIVKNIQNLLIDKAKLQLLPNNHEINQGLRNAYSQASQQLKLQLRRIERSRWDLNVEGEQMTHMEDKIRVILHKLSKFKQINIYFNDLRKQAGSLEADVEKFLLYLPKADDLQKKLELFLTEQSISELLMKEYQKSFNPNNFIADLIDFFYFLHQNGLLEMPQEEQCVWLRNRDLLLIENTNIIFRQICQISDKYTLVEQQLAGAYIHLDFIKGNPQEQAFSQKKYKLETEVVENKMKELSVVAQKIRRYAGNLDGLLTTEETIVLPEQPDLFETMNQKFDFPLKQRNDSFFAFLEELYEGKQLLQGGSETNFNFIKLKIIKAEMRWHLNRLFSALNVASHLVNQLHDNITPVPKHYSFNPPEFLIKNQLNAKRSNFYTERAAQPAELQLLSKNITVLQREQGFALHLQRSKVVYPSALHSYYYLLKYLLCLSTILQEKKIYSQELLLEITSIKADQLMQWAEASMNLFEMIKGKYYGCYGLLKEYLQLAFQVHWVQELQYVKREVPAVEGLSKLLGFYSAKEKKAGWINQIIFQLDSSFDILECLSKLVDIERKHNRTSYCADHHHFYQLILNEVIETRNNLKFDRCYSLSALHQLFGFPAARPSNLKDLAQQLAPISKTYMRLPDLLRLYASQSRLKRQVFKAELYWISIAQPSVRNKFIISNQKKKITFRDFLQENAKFLLNMGDKSLQYYLNNLEEVERAVLLFGYEVERLKLIQCSLLLLKPDFPLEDHIAAFSHKQLSGFFNYCANFNFVQDVYIRREKKAWILTHIKKLLGDSKLKFSDLNMQPNIVGLKHLLARLIFVIYSFEHHYTHEDCLKLKTKVIDQAEMPEYHLKLEVLRSKRDIIKEYEESHFLDWQSLAELVQTYQLLMLITFDRVLKRDDISSQDKIYLKSIMKDLPSYESFCDLDRLRDIQKTKQFSNNNSKAHSLSSLKWIVGQYRQKRQNFKGYGVNWEAIDYLFMLSEIGIVTRRLFCNQMIKLKHQVCGEEWKHFNKQSCLSKLRQIFDQIFVEQLNKFLIQELNSSELLNPQHNIAQISTLLAQICRKQLIEQYDGKFYLEEHQKRTIVLFDEERGVEVDFKQDSIIDTPMKLMAKKNRCNVKRGMLKAVTMENVSTGAMASALQQKVNLQIVKESLPMRKMIYHLQLQQKRIRDEIAWQTCKLQHTVINKINRFIEQSSLDQKQSLINFKYTVNLQTIKGIENVIHERIQIFGKTQTEQDAFLTEPHSKQEQNQRSQESLLDINVRNVFSHVKMIKVFWAWKNIYLSKHYGVDEFTEFSNNAQRILHNKQNIDKMNHLQELRQDCSKQEILCNLIKEQNALLNSSIRSVKISHLKQKLSEFKQKHGVEVENESMLREEIQNHS